MTDNERAFNLIIGEGLPFTEEYPIQEDPLYWSKVPAVFEKVFADPEALRTFKGQWITHRVPLYAMWKDDKQREHNMGFAVDLFDRISGSDESQLSYYHELLKERTIGHTEESLELSTGRLVVGDRPYDGIGLMRILRLHNIISYQMAMDKNIATDYDVIVEIGGGVGEFCKMAREMGFKGKYYGIDFKPMCDINAYNNEYHPDNAYCQTVEELPIFDLNTKVLVVATWSFSEMDPTLRNPVLARLSRADWLIGFQRMVFGIDNLVYFINDFLDHVKPLKKTLVPLNWVIWNGGNFYLFCKQD